MITNDILNKLAHLKGTPQYSRIQNALSKLQAENVRRAQKGLCFNYL